MMIEGKKIFVTHGIFQYDPIHEKEETFVRNTDNKRKYEEKKNIPLPLKLREELKKRYIEWFHVQKSIKWFDKRIKIGLLIEGKIEFTIAECPEEHITVITICHPFIKEDHFQRKEGIKWVQRRMEWALKHPKRKARWWLYRLER